MYRTSRGAVIQWRQSDAITLIVATIVGAGAIASGEAFDIPVVTGSVVGGGGDGGAIVVPAITPSRQVLSLGNKYAWETRTYSIDFSFTGIFGGVFSSLSARILRYSGARDPNPPRVSVSVFGPLVYVTLAEGTVGNVYVVDLLASLSDGRQIQTYAYVTIVADPAS